jgi:hypothetical protein
MPFRPPASRELSTIYSSAIRGSSKERRVVACLLVGFSLISCNSTVTGLATWPASDPRCRQKPETAPAVPEDPQKPAAWASKDYDVLARGRYTPPFQDDVVGKDADAVFPGTVVTLAELGLNPGDYVGLRAKGGWLGGKGDTQHSDMGAVFEDGNGVPLPPANFGQEEPFHFWGPNGGPPYAEVDSDFRVNPNYPIYVRIPKDAQKIAFSASDYWVSDNCPPAVEHGSDASKYDCPGQTFQVTVSEPNRPPSGARLPVAVEVGEDFGGLIRAGVNPAEFPEAKGFSSSPFATNADPATDAQWRGNYAISGWRPDMSKFRGDRPTLPSKRHWGWDVFAPFNTKLIAPVWPADLHFMITPPEAAYGSIAVFGFKYHGTPWLLFYAHLNSFEGKDRRITSAEIIGRAGCSGNATGNGCEDELASGGRTNHVHVGLMRIENNKYKISDEMACDPAMVLNWTVR